MKIKSAEFVRSIDDLRILKLHLEKKARKREKKIFRRIKGIKENVTPENVLSEFLQGAGIDSPFLSAIPSLLKYREPVMNLFKKIPNKKVLFLILGGVGAGILGYLVYNNFGDIKSKAKKLLSEKLIQSFL